MNTCESVGRESTFTQRLFFTFAQKLKELKKLPKLKHFPLLQKLIGVKVCAIITKCYKNYKHASAKTKNVNEKKEIVFSNPMES